ncbi:MAG: ferrous iron transport protein B [Eubacteriales bacterium]
MPIKIALAGNPNSGKTTMFNELTGSMQYVGNWPGVTVEKKEGRLKEHRDVILVDLPGIYSLSPYSLEEVVTRDFLLNEKPDAIINIVDATNIERNLYLTTQLMEAGIPMVIALNMMDVIRKSGEKIDINKLEKLLGCKIVETSALRGIGLREAVHAAMDLAKHKAAVPLRKWFDTKTEQAIDEIESLDLIKDNPNKRWYAVKLFERDEKVLEKFQLPKDTATLIEGIIASVEKEAEDDSESIIANARYNYVGNIVSQTMRKKLLDASSASDRIDKIITNRWLALPIFFFIMWGIYFVSIQTLGSITTEGIGVFFDWVGQSVSALLTSVGTADWVNGLLVNGIIRGVGAVLGFVPQLMILFLFLSLMEDIGYMARVAFIMDKVFRKFGLSGKSFIPMLIGTGCSVPGIMASRTIENDRDRKMTIMLTPFIPCGAKLPVFALFVGAFFPQNAWVGPSMYMLGIGMVILSGLILKRTSMFKGKPSPFVMELPPYRMPLVHGVLFQMWDRGKAFIKRAGTVILVASAAVWFLQSFNWSMQAVDTSQSMLAGIGHAIAPLFIPLGFGNWQSSVAILTGVIAKENVVATLGVLLGNGGQAANLSGSIGQLFTPISAYAFMAFILLAAPCVAAISATRREMGGAKWTLRAVLFQTGTAYVVSCLIYQVGRLVFGG